MFYFYVVAVGFTIWMAVEAVRRDERNPWLWVMAIFWPIGAVVYFFTKYIRGGSLPAVPNFDLKKRVGNIRWGGADQEAVRVAEAEVARLHTAPAWSDYAQALREAGRIDDAIDAAGQAVDKDGMSAEALNELGLSFVAAERYAEAIEPLQRVVSIDPDFSMHEALFLLADSLHREGRLVESKGRFLQLLESSSRPQFLYGLASVQAGLEDTVGVQATLTRLIHEAEAVPDYLQSDVEPWVKQARRTLKQLEN